jgi:hypothetical protein
MPVAAVAPEVPVSATVYVPGVVTGSPEPLRGVMQILLLQAVKLPARTSRRRDSLNNDSYLRRSIGI